MMMDLNRFPLSGKDNNDDNDDGFDEISSHWQR